MNSTTAPTPSPDPAVSLLRLYLLRAVYLLVAAGLATAVWPGVLNRAAPWELMEGVVACMLAAFSLLCVLGLRHPLKLLPVLLWELLWKSIWLLDVALPAWRADRLDAGTASTAAACLLAVAIALVVPWRYVVRQYLATPGDRWR